MTQPIQKNQVTVALDRLLEQFKGLPNIEGVIRSFVGQYNTLEEDCFSLLNERSISTAIGVQLDALGALVNEPRKGKEDEPYRIAILTRIGVNNSEGTPNQVMALLKNITKGDTIKMWEHFPVSAIYYTNTPFEGAPCVSDTLQLISPATSGDVITIFDPNEDAFTPTDLVLEEFIIVDEFGNFLTTSSGSTLVTNTGDRLVSGLGEGFKLTGSEAVLGELISGKDYAGVNDGRSIYGVLSEIVPTTLDVIHTAAPDSIPQAGEPLMEAGEPTAQASSLLAPEGFLISADGVNTESLEIWSASTLEMSLAPYGVLPEACKSGVDNIKPPTPEVNFLRVDNDTITVDSETITVDQVTL